MIKINETKLNHLMAVLPQGLVLTTHWLEIHHISAKLAWWYVQSGWLERVGEKAYKKTGDKVSWVGAVAALQSQLRLSLHVGGKTALQLLGQTHTLPQAIKQVMLFANPKTKIPTWLAQSTLWDVQFEVFRTALFQNDDTALGLIKRSLEGVHFQLSCPERAAMEMLYLVTDHQSFSEAALFMADLKKSRPTMVQSLLEKCQSIKVKRLFLYLSEQYQHSWLVSVDLNKIDLGQGKRVIGGGGKYHAKYLLSVPDALT